MFEGSEKKIEVILSKNGPSLFERPVKFWSKIVKSCNAEIISRAQFPKIHSYILSESSLFVWERRLALITCGKTALSKALIKIIKSLPKDSIELCFFQRKNEYFPQIQKSSFSDDVQKIKKKIPGFAYRFGSLHDHHFFLFHSHSDAAPSSQDQTLEILMYDSELVKDSSEQTIKKLKRELEKNFYGFEIHDHRFKPVGYSLNAVRDEFYYTLHITPEESFFYISFETNIQNEPAQSITQKILNIFKPESFDFILFDLNNISKEAAAFEGYSSKSSFYKMLDCSYSVAYKNFYKTSAGEQAPFLMDEL